MRFEGCVKANEISLTRKAANRHAVALALKNVAGQARETQTEKTDMADPVTAADISKAALKVAKSIGLMDDVTKSYFAGLDEDKQLAFVDKSFDDQKTEAHAAKAAADRAAVEAEAAKSGKSAREVELEKRLESQGAEIETLKATQADAAIEKRADTEFAGFPGGSAAVVPLLKAYAKLPEDARKVSEEMLKNQIKLAGATTKALGGRVEQGDVAKAAEARITEAAKAYADSNKCSFEDAWVKVIEKAEFADDVALAGG